MSGQRKQVSGEARLPEREAERKEPSHVMPRCPACGAPEQLVWVHGHGQCAHCHMNVMPCCDGAVCDR